MLSALTRSTSNSQATGSIRQHFVRAKLQLFKVGVRV